MSDFRMVTVETDQSGFTNTLVEEVGGMVGKSRKGTVTPMKLQSEKDCILYLGKPSAEYPEVFEAIAYTRSAPLWFSSVIGDDALYGGVDVTASAVSGFGLGRDISTFNYTTVKKDSTDSIGVGNGVTAIFTGTLTNFPVVDESTFKVKVAGIDKVCTMATGGAITGADVSGSVTLATGVYTLTFTGTPGSYAEVTTTVNGSTVYDLSSGGTDKSILINIDGVSQTLNLGQSATTTRAAVISAINAAFGYTAASISTNYIKITGRNGSTTGVVSVSDPLTGASALTLVFAATALTDNGSNPVGAIPKYNEAITTYSHYTVTGSTISHSFFNYSPCVDDLSVNVKWVSGQKFIVTLYQVLSTGNSLLSSYNYSLIRELDGYGASLYYEDVFQENPYVSVKVNSSFVGTYSLTAETIVPFTGGSRGSDPIDGDYLTSWNSFQKANKYKVKTFIDAKGNSAITLNTLIQTYQPWAQGLSVVPIGNSATQGKSFRTSLALDTDDVCLYHNWSKIQDDYNNSFAWISNAGSIGRKWALMNSTYDAGSPAGVDGPNMQGGQLSDWKIKDVENDFTDSEMQDYYNAQINPIVLDDAYGLMIRGDQTLQVTNSDTSFVGTRRVYKYMVDVITKQILVKQIFKLNNAMYRLMAKSQIDDFVTPIQASGWIREFKVVCDSSNNTDIVLNNRQFVVDFYVKITPNSQFIKLNLIRLPQGAVITA